MVIPRYDFHRISLHQDKITYLEAKSNYTIIFFGKEPRIVPKSLKEIMTQVNKVKFCRCHRSFVVNFDYIKQVDLSSNKIILLSGESFPISRRSRSYVKKFVKDYSSF